MELLKLIQQLHFVGLGSALQTILSTLERDWVDKRHLRTRPISTVVSPTDIMNTTRLSSGERFRFVCSSARIDLEVFFLTPNLVRFTWGLGTVPVPYALARQEWPPVELQHEVSSSEYSLASNCLRVAIYPDGGVRFSDLSGCLYREELPPEFCGNRFTHRALLDPDAHIYGLGERAAPLNLRGGFYRMWNTDPRGSYGPGKDPIYTCIPVYMELHRTGSYLVFYENSYPAFFSFTESIEAAFDGGPLRYYVAVGKPDTLLQLYSELTGRAPLPPRWALGYHQSGWGYKTEADIRAVAASFSKHNLPISAIHLDIDYMDGFRVFTVDEKDFPDLPTLARDLEDQGISLVAILDPGVKIDRGYYLYEEGLKKKAFCIHPRGKPMTGLVWPGRSVFPDFTNPKVREWWGTQYQRLLDVGINGFWHDMNEPSSFSAWGDMRLPLSTRHNLEGRGGDHRQGHNLYGLLMARAGYEGLRRMRSDHRPWIITRSGWAGFQRYAWNWTGDIDTSWDALRQTIKIVLNLGISGQPYSGGDIGGFNGNPSPELYTRWFQTSAFLPFFRTHSAKDVDSREPWTFGERIIPIIRSYLNLRYQLLPFFYSLAWETSRTGEPIIRPLFWDHPEECSLWDVDDAFLVGNDLLIVPVFEEGAMERSFILPPGDWYHFWDDTIYSGIKSNTILITLENIPVFVRAGSLLPMLENDRLILHVYVPPRKEDISNVRLLQLYSDSGDGYPASPEDWRLDIFTLEHREQKLVIKRTSEGNYPFPYSQIQLRFHGSVPVKASIDRNEVLIHDNGVSTQLFTEITITDI